MLKTLLNAIKPRAPAATIPNVAEDEAKALIRAGNAMEDAGQVQEALALYDKAAALAPALPATHLNIGIAREALGQADAARAAYERVLALDPANPFGAYNLGKLEYLAERMPEAEALLRKALASRPDFPDALVLLASVCDATGQLGAAADALDQALRLQPDYPGALYNQADVLRKLNRLDAAEAAARRAVELAPDLPEHHARLADVLYLEGFPAEALEPLRRAMALAPGQPAWRSQELFYMTLCGDVPPQALFDRHQALGRDIENAVAARPHAMRARGARLRVGFVSEDFRVHPTALFVMPVLDHITRDRYEVFCYSSWARPDHITQWLRERSDHWLDTSRLRDAELAEAIAADGIDVLVDLNGHTSGGRLGAFAARPAPVQVGWIGYLNTTGLTRMDFRLTDRRCDPPDASGPLHTERLLYLPHSQWCYRPFIVVDGAAAAPCERNGFVTFGSLNNVGKLTPEMIARWGRILAAVPDSRLLVADVASARKREAILAAVEHSGVDRGRVEFAPRADLAGYYRLMDRIDIALDSYPYGGGTTTFDALWMGVPVVTAAGPTSASRSASSLLAALGLDPWIAADVDGFERLAVARAQDTASVAGLRRTLRARLQASPLMDEPAFVRAFEEALDEAWAARPVS